MELERSYVIFVKLFVKARRLADISLLMSQNKVPHQRLLLKLKAHGIGNDVINWIKKWLTHRRQRVIVDGEISNWKSVLSGVTQGSVLGPILFLIYINDLEDDISSKVLKFPDDTKVFRMVLMIQINKVYRMI